MTGRDPNPPPSPHTPSPRITTYLKGRPGSIRLKVLFTNSTLSFLYLYCGSVIVLTSIVIHARRKLLAITGRVVAQAKRFSAEIASDVKRSADGRKQTALHHLKSKLDTMVSRTRQVVSQTKARIFGDDTHVENKLLLSMFEPSTEIIRKGKASKPTEFGKMLIGIPLPKAA
jgi:hypothetical protein